MITVVTAICRDECQCYLIHNVNNAGNPTYLAEDELS